MIKIDFQKQVLPHLLVLASFILVLVVYFSPVFFGKKSLEQHDIMQWKGGAKELLDHYEKTGEQSMWTNSMFGGMPAYYIYAKPKGNVMPQVQILLSLYFPAPANMFLLTLMCGYLFFFLISQRYVLSALGAFVYAFSTYTVIVTAAGHNNKVMAMAFVPMILAGMYVAYHRHALWGAVLVGLGLALQFTGNHLQITYYTAIICVAFGISEAIYAIKEKTIKKFALASGSLLLAVALASGTYMVTLLTTQEYTKHSTRGKTDLTPKDGETVSSGLDRDYAFAFSNQIDEVITILLPHYYGGASQGPLGSGTAVYEMLTEEMQVPKKSALGFMERMPLYFGDMSIMSGPTFFGTLVCFFFVIGLFVVEGRHKWWLVAATIISIVLSWGRNFELLNYFLFDYLPGYNKMRAVTMTLVMAQITMATLAVMAVVQLINATDREKTIKQFEMGAATFFGILALLLVVAFFRDYTGPNDEQMAAYYGQNAFQNPEMGKRFMDAIAEDRQGLVLWDITKAATISVIAYLLLAMWMAPKTNWLTLKTGITLGQMNSTIVVVVLGVLAVGELWLTDLEYLNAKMFKKNVEANYFEPTPADQMILGDKTLSYRVYNVQNPYNDARTSYFHKSIGGYHAVKMRRYQEFIDANLSYADPSNPTDEESEKINTMLNMLNTRWYITGDPKMPAQVNSGAFGNGWFINDIQTVQTADEELNLTGMINPRITAVVDGSRFKVTETKFAKDTTAYVLLKSYAPNKLTYETNNANAGFVVFSEIYYADGWQATVDGKPADHIRVNYILRGMQVPAGNHTIEFEFKSASFTKGNTIALVSCVLLLGSVLALSVVSLRAKDGNRGA